MQMKRKRSYRWFISWLLLLTMKPSLAQIGLWTSAAELSGLPMSGPAWQAVLTGANQNTSKPKVSNQDDNTNVYVLAAAIVYARTGDVIYKDKVAQACETLAAKERPGGRTLAWARETGAYVLAADLVGYRTTEFESWVRNMAEVYVASDGLTLLEMFKRRPNNWGSHAFGALCVIYRYLGDSLRLNEIRNYWIQSVLGPNPGLFYGSDLSWHVDPNNPRLINPKGAIKSGMNIDGLIPDDMRRGASLREPPAHTDYPWEFLQGQIMAARILERAGLSIWAVGDSVLYRAAYALQVRLEEKYGDWAATDDDEWMLPFLDAAYGTKWSGQQSRLWQHGKNAGWGYVVWRPKQDTLTVNTVGSGKVLLDPPGGIYNDSTVVKLTALADPGWQFDQWGGDLTGSTNPAAIAMLANQTVTAVFARPIQYTLTVNKVGFGSIMLDPPGGIYQKGAVVKLTAIADAGWVFDQWIGQLSGSQNPATITIDGNKGIAATFLGKSGTTYALNVTEDCYVRGGQFADANFDDDPKLRVKGSDDADEDSQVYLKFNLSEVSGSISAATLKLFCQTLPDGSPATASVYTIANDKWHEATTTWNNAPAAGAWLDSQTTISAAGTVYTFDVTPFVTAEYAGDKLVTFLIKDEHKVSKAVEFNHKKSATPPALIVTVNVATQTDEKAHPGPQILELYQNRPNPFKQRTALRYKLSRAAHVSLSIFDLNGREVGTLVNAVQNAGDYIFQWDGADGSKMPLPAGVYFVHLQSDGVLKTIKIILIR